MKYRVTAYDDRALIDWLLELIEEGSPDFLSFLAEAAILASPGEYAIIRPSLLLLKQHISAQPRSAVRVTTQHAKGTRT